MIFWEFKIIFLWNRRKSINRILKNVQQVKNWISIVIYFPSFVVKQIVIIIEHSIIVLRDRRAMILIFFACATHDPDQSRRNSFIRSTQHRHNINYYNNSYVKRVYAVQLLFQKAVLNKVSQT